MGLISFPPEGEEVTFGAGALKATIALANYAQGEGVVSSSPFLGPNYSDPCSRIFCASSIDFEIATSPGA